MEKDQRKNRLAIQVNSVATAPGVYLFKNRQGRILYVGKARNLRKRVQSYFQPGRHHDAKTRVLLGHVVELETIITHTEKEALILESNLIKRHRPRYNVVLKDDKRYPVLRLDLTQEYPNLTIARKIREDGALYFGPYASSSAVRQTLKFIHKTFKLRKCHNKTFASRTRPCLNYQMGLCLGPCCNKVDKNTYQTVVKEVIAFLRGRTPALINTVKVQMKRAAKQEDYEKAALLRDKMLALEKTLERQLSVISDHKDRDVIALLLKEKLSAAALLKVRGGFLMGGRQYVFEQVVGDHRAQMEALLHQLYGTRPGIPAQILVNHLPENIQTMVAWLTEARQGKVDLSIPRRGEKAGLLKLAIQNAQKAIDEKLNMARANLQLLSRLQKRLHLESAPRHIECLDNSNLAGSLPVAAMVMFKTGRPYPGGYRRYRIRLEGKPDDYAYMAHVLGRRFGKGDESEPCPDLLLVDGGKGHLNVALSVLTDLGIGNKMEVAAIAKRDESAGETADKVYLPQRSNPVQFGKEPELLLFLQRVRDEAHRVAISYQRERRGKKSLASQLDVITGIGPKRKAALLKKYGSIKKIAQAGEQDISQVPGISEKLAQMIVKALAQGARR